MCDPRHRYWGGRAINVWEWVFFIGAYGALVVCAIACWRIGVNETPLKGFLEFLILIGFCVAYWVLESYAITHGGHYVYTGDFPDPLKLFPFAPGASTPGLGCPQTWEPHISATVPIMEATLTFALMWTGRLLLTPENTYSLEPFRPLLLPLLVGLVGLALDGYLDPVVAKAYACGPPLELDHAGLGFWQWFATPEMADYWFDIPLYNFAAWYAAPIILVAFVLLLGWGWNFIVWASDGFPSGAGVSPTAAVLGGVLRALILFGFLIMFILAPGAEPPLVQAYIMLGTIVWTIYMVVHYKGTFDRNNPWRWEFIVPGMIFAVFPLLGLVYFIMLLLAGTLATGAFIALLLVSLVFAGLCTYYVFSPYWKP